MPKTAPLPKATQLYGRWLLLALILVIIDQITKWSIALNFDYLQRINITPFFDLILVHNTGAAFSFLAQSGGWQRWLFVAISFTAAVLISYLLWRHAHKRLFSLALTLILAGAIGNLIDRLFLGYVIDFLLVYWKDHYFPAFNVADTCITIGAGLLILDELLRIRREKQAQS